MIHNSSTPARVSSNSSKLTIIISIFALILGWSIFVPSSAQATQINVKSLNHYDILLQGDETRQAGTTKLGPIQVCGNIVDVASKLNSNGAKASVFLQTAGKAAVTAIIAFASAAYLCGLQVTICASKAYYDHKWAGMTVQAVPPRIWCWEY
jgi:predicted PurR-regulated permease PerM